MANTVPRVKHLVGTNKVVTLEDVYGSIKDVTGIQKIDDTVTLPPDYDSYKSPQRLNALGIVRRAHVILSNKKIRTIYIVAANCPKIGSLIGLEYITGSGITIKSASFPERVYYR